MILNGTCFLTSSQPCVRFCGVNKFYGDFQALHQIDLTIARGEKWVICGPSGSGKSTLIRTINGLEGIDSGQLFLFGEPVTPAYLRRLQGRVGMVFQQFNLFPHMTVLENLMVAPVHTLGLSTQAAKTRALGLLERVRIQAQADKYPHQLSGGQQQRV
ncbi:amino acid ABC transporter ATP-binding protein, partial [Klebsiella pneumoniae]